MNRLNRLFTRPLIFALAAAGMVVAVGEPVEDRFEAEVAADLALPVEVALPVSELESDPELATAAEARRGEHAARLRWLITLPHARNSCCRRPV